VNDPLLLHDEPLTGAFGVRRWVTTQRDVHLVDAASLADATAAVEAACNIWGGAYHLLVPVPENATVIPEPWQTLVRDTGPTRTATRGRLPVPEVAQEPDVGGMWRAESSGVMPLTVLATMDQPSGGFRTVRTANALDPDDPWTLAYTAIWGRLPEALDPGHLRWAGLRDNLRYADVVPIDSTPPAEPGPADLLGSLRDSKVRTAASMSCVRLGFATAPVGSQFGIGAPTFPIRFHRARECGPNIVVVYEPGSVADMCLIWHLRAVHGLRPGFPLALPLTTDVPAALRFWWAEFAMHSWGLRSATAHLASASVDVDTLTALAGAAGPQWSAVTWSDVLQPSWGCGVSSAEVAMFERGRAELSAVHPTEDAALGRHAVTELTGSLELVVTPTGTKLPPSGTLARPFIAEYRGGAVLHVGGTRETVAMEWPTGLTVLDAVVRDHGLRGETSEPGRLAETLLRRTDELGGLLPLMHPGIQALLARLGARHGMSWFKQRLRALLPEGVEADTSIEVRLALIEARVAEMAGLPSDEEQSDITFNDVQRALNDGVAAQSWLSWADEVGLVLRGPKCDVCAARAAHGGHWPSLHPRSCVAAAAP
jgi:hypothetical protein